MSGAQTSASMPLNQLYDMVTGQTGITLQHGQNQLLQQQQEITDHDIAMTGQAAAPLLNLNEDQAAAAYPGWLQDMQSRGLAKYAPATYPGHAATAALVQRAMPILQQIQTGFLTTPGSADATKRLNDIYTGATVSGTTPGGSTATGGTGGTSDNNFGNIRPVGAASGFNTYETPQDGIAAMSSNLAAYASQHGIKTLNGLTARWAPKGDGNNDPVAYAAALGKTLGLDPNAEINLADPLLQTRLIPAMAAIEKGRPFSQPPEVLTAGIQAGLSGKSGSTAPPMATTPSGGPPSATATPSPYRVASNAPTPPPTPVVPAPTYTDTETGLPVIGTQPGAPAPQAQIPQPPANRVMPGGADGPPAPPPAPVAQPPAPRANLPRATDVPQGANSPQIQQAQRLRQAAAQIEVEAARNPYDKRLQAEAAAKAADLKQRADFLMQSDTVVQTQEGQLHPLTGKIDDPTKPIPHYVYDPTQHAYIDTTGTNKPEFEPAQRDSAVAQRDVMELGPKVANGTATQQEQARYATAVETYRQPTLRENPVTKETVRVNTRELPAGFPEPPGLGGTGSGGPAVSSGSNVVIPGYSPQQQEIERDPAKAKVADEQYGRDSKNVGDLTAGVTTAQNDNLRTKEMLDLLNNGDFSSGPGSETRTRIAAWFQRWAPASLSGWEKQSADLKGAAAAQAFQKLAFQGVTTQEKESSPRGGILATQLFQRNNPGLDLLNPANISLLDMKLIQNQANIDYGRDALGHFTTQETRYGDTHKYSSLEQFNTQWINQRNPQVYSAAMGAVSGQPVEKWADGLSDAEYKRALGIVERAKPGAIVNGRSGRIVVQPAGTPPIPPGMTVVR